MNKLKAGDIVSYLQHANLVGTGIVFRVFDIINERTDEEFASVYWLKIGQRSTIQTKYLLKEIEEQ